MHGDTTAKERSTWKAKLKRTFGQGGHGEHEPNLDKRVYNPQPTDIQLVTVRQTKQKLFEIARYRLTQMWPERSVRRRLKNLKNESIICPLPSSWSIRSCRSIGNRSVMPTWPSLKSSTGCSASRRNTALTHIRTLPKLGNEAPAGKHVAKGKRRTRTTRQNGPTRVLVLKN